MQTDTYTNSTTNKIWRAAKIHVHCIYIFTSVFFVWWLVALQSLYYITFFLLFFWYVQTFYGKSDERNKKIKQVVGKTNNRWWKTIAYICFMRIYSYINKKKIYRFICILIHDIVIMHTCININRDKYHLYCIVWRTLLVQMAISFSNILYNM